MQSISFSLVVSTILLVKRKLENVTTQFIISSTWLYDVSGREREWGNPQKPYTENVTRNIFLSFEDIRFPFPKIFCEGKKIVYLLHDLRLDLETDIWNGNTSLWSLSWKRKFLYIQVLNNILPFKYFSKTLFLPADRWKSSSSWRNMFK